MCELLRSEININGTTFTYPEYTSPESSKLGLDQYTRNVIEGYTTTVYSTKSICKPIIAYTVTKTIYSPTTVPSLSSAYPSPCSVNLETATRQTLPSNKVLSATGATMGLLLVLLVVIIGWAWTCWTIGRKKNLTR